MEQTHLPVVGKGIEQPSVFHLFFAVGAQGDELGQFEGDVVILNGFAGPGAAGKIAIQLWAADAVFKLIHVAEPATHLRAILAYRKPERRVKVGDGDDLGTFFTFQNFELHNTFAL